MFCIFGSADQFASAHYIANARLNKLVAYGRRFKASIKRDKYLPEVISAGTPKCGKMDGIEADYKCL